MWMHMEMAGCVYVLVCVLIDVCGWMGVCVDGWTCVYIDGGVDG